jgi:hypothetical protein
MGFYSNKVALVLLILLILIVLIPLIVFLILAQQDNRGQPQMPTPSPRTNQALEGAPPRPVNSHNVSVYPSSGSSPASGVNDHSGDISWRSPVLGSCRVISQVSIRRKSHGSSTSALVT